MENHASCFLAATLLQFLRKHQLTALIEHQPPRTTGTGRLTFNAPKGEEKADVQAKKTANSVGDVVEQKEPTVDGKRDLFFTRSHTRDHSAAHVLPSVLLSHRLQSQEVLIAQNLQKEEKKSQRSFSCGDSDFRPAIATRRPGGAEQLVKLFIP